MFFSHTILFLLQPPPHHVSHVSQLQTEWAWQWLSGYVPTTRGCPGSCCKELSSPPPKQSHLLHLPQGTRHQQEVGYLNLQYL